MSDAGWLEETIHRQIPITRDMGLRVKSYDGRSLRLFAPIEPNLNHKHTAFGGSLASILTLAGWGLLYMKLRELERPVHIVIHRSEFLYHQPVANDFSAYCDLPPEPIWNRFLDSLERRGRARIGLSSWVAADENAAATMEGRFVALRDDS